MIKSIFDLAGTGVVAGAQAGRRVLAKLIAETASPGEPELCFLDFSRVEVATVSFLRESVIGYRDFTRQSAPDVYPVLANAGAAVLEELELYLANHGDALWSCELDGHGKPRHARVLGVLDPAERETFDLIVARGRATAPELADLHQKVAVKPTAWNNRLASLANKGLLLEERIGKAKAFSPLLGTS